MRDIKITGPLLDEWVAKEVVDAVKGALSLGGISVVKATMSSSAITGTEIILKIEKDQD